MTDDAPIADEERLAVASAVFGDKAADRIKYDLTPFAMQILDYAVLAERQIARLERERDRELVAEREAHSVTGARYQAERDATAAIVRGEGSGE